MSLKKMSLLVSSGLVFFLVMSTVIRTVTINSKRLKEKVTVNLKYEIKTDNMFSSFNYIKIDEIKNDEDSSGQELKEEQVPDQNIEENNSDDNSSDAVFVGKMTGYGADCAGCSGIGNLACNTLDGSRHTLSNDGEYYYDSSYGSVRIVAADLSKFPCGTIVKVEHPILGSFYAVVMDTGGSVQRAFQNGIIWMDLAFKTESDPNIYASTSNNTTYTVERWGW